MDLKLWEMISDLKNVKAMMKDLMNVSGDALLVSLRQKRHQLVKQVRRKDIYQKQQNSEELRN